MQVATGVWRIRADNPSPMTGTGTNTYVLHGPEGAVVIDPGPALPAHLAAVLAAVQDAPLRAILVTHPHLDHSALVADLKAATGAQVYGFGRATAGRSAVMQRLAAGGLQGGGEGVDAGFAPDVLLADGAVLALAGLQIEVIHTPGHMGGHLSFALGEDLFSGDHVMGWASTLISPPDGDMAAYMASLARLSARAWRQFLPGHGERIADPATRLAELTAHRRARETAICAALTAGPARPIELATQLYTDTPPALLPAAARNILAHLIDLHDRNVVTSTEAPGPEAEFKMI
ncbi:MAG: MBL fold metallo-hydrolase [Cypionkella sp.]|uniref:MBL fold metallo-hydrolase n=1 Tax=Cypionkella sp. TaxID=2811411 RepID=UPI002ABBF0BC|nr:MBL fold metallo-hydrolase [Cypionkella sp.]MDZ4310008.1 MBL fold metallo-hydrolase [Cypionkella sp.]